MVPLAHKLYTTKYFRRADRRTMSLDPVLLSRLQWAWVIAWHILLPLSPWGLPPTSPFSKGFICSPATRSGSAFPGSGPRSSRFSFGRGVIQGFNVKEREFAGTSFDWLAPFSLAIGFALMFGYRLLGATWLVLKTEGELQGWARRAAAVCLVAVLVAIAGVSIWTPLAHPEIARRWFSWPNVALLSPVPIIIALIALGE